MSLQLTLCSFVANKKLAQSLEQLLSGDRYCLNKFHSCEALLNFIKNESEKIDCLVVFNESTVLPLFNQLYEQGIFLPTVIIEPKKLAADRDFPHQTPYLYHRAEVRLLETQIEAVTSYIEQAIAQFLCLAPSCLLSAQSNSIEGKHNLPPSQQHRLAQKLGERLGYLGVYYKRNPENFYRNLSSQEQQAFWEELNLNYRTIVLSYFAKNSQVNQLIDDFVNQAFVSDISASRILEMHMELMDEFSHQLKLEGRSEEILLDYRLTLIDIIAHLCEMYRRSVPREDLSTHTLLQ